MKEYLNSYKLRITALSPIHVGSDEKIGKKEYIYNPRSSTVIIPDLSKMYLDIKRKGKLNEYIKYMSDNRGYPLGFFLRDNGFSFGDYERWKDYEMEGGEALSKSGKDVPKEISCFLKDPYGKPYIPGSTIKGILRTALIIYEYKNNPLKFIDEKNAILNKSSERANRNYFLNRETVNLEAKAFNTLGRDEKLTNALNCNLSGLIISDSAPLTESDLTLSQKIDVNLEGAERTMPVLREALKPGTRIDFMVTIDSTICPYTIEDIKCALYYYQNMCDSCFNKRFNLESNDENIIWIGGGTGFVSKTIIYSLFDKEAVKVADNIFKRTLKNYRSHKHDRNLREYKLAPHVAKCTRYQGKLYDMGKAKYEFCTATCK